jgi:hypothetical protein
MGPDYYGRVFRYFGNFTCGIFRFQADHPPLFKRVKNSRIVDKGAKGIHRSGVTLGDLPGHLDRPADSLAKPENFGANYLHLKASAVTPWPK